MPGYSEFDIEKLATMSFVSRIHYYANLFLGKPYVSAQMPGATGSKIEKYIQDLLTKKEELSYSFDGFDCVTYVEIVLALAAIHSPKAFESERVFFCEFEQRLKAIRYKDGHHTFWNRNHIQSTDWNPNNTSRLPAITATLTNNVQLAYATVDRVSWLHKTKSIESRFGTGLEEFKELLQARGISVAPVEAETQYIALHEGLTIDSLALAKWPEVSVVSIVRPGWDLTKMIGTQLNISHLGLVFKQQLQPGAASLVFYHASSDLKQVTKIEFSQYLKQFAAHQTIKGFNVLGVADIAPRVTPEPPKEASQGTRATPDS